MRRRADAFARLEDAFVDSFLAADLAIWDVVRERRVLASSLPMRQAFAIRDELASRNPEGGHHVRYRARLAGGVP